MCLTCSYLAFINKLVHSPMYKIEFVCTKKLSCTKMAFVQMGYAIA